MATQPLLDKERPTTAHHLSKIVYIENKAAHKCLDDGFIRSHCHDIISVVDENARPILSTVDLFYTGG